MNVNELIAAINDGTYDENLKAVYVTDKAVEEQKPRYVETLNDFGELFGYDREVNISLLRAEQKFAVITQTTTTAKCLLRLSIWMLSQSFLKTMITSSE